MFKKILLSSTVLMALVSLCACSIKTSGEAGAPSPLPNDGFFDSKATVQGPTVEGQWQSACHTPYDTGSRIFKIKFEGGTVVRDELIYSDDECKQLSKENVFKGRFRFIDIFGDGSFGIEYAFDLGNGAHTYPQEKILLQNSALYIGNFSTGEMATVLSDEPLFLTQAGTPPGTTPTPTPAPAPAPGTGKAILATNFAEAKYAICSTQGIAVLVDFMGTSIAKSGSGSAKVGFKYCNSKSAFQWRKTSNAVTVTFTNGYPRIDFDSGVSGYPDNIRTSSSYKGLDGWIETFATFDGNSGGCYFTTNGGNDGVPFMDECN